MTHTHHGLDYVELAAPDLAAATAFYATVFGWRFTDYGGAYAAILEPGGDAEVGGLNPEAEPGTGGALVLMWSDDLEATQDAVEAAGGEVTRPIYAFPGGRRFHFTDPAGNGLGVWGR